MGNRKRFAALARVSSREQEREGFSLEVQEEALHAYARREGGEIVKMFRIAETATKPAQRHTFKELLEYAEANAHLLDGLLFYKIDRAARNIFDFVELVRLEHDSGLKFIAITQPTENTPTGRLSRLFMAGIASFYTEQQSDDVRDGLRQRVLSGLFVGKAPYGYRNIRVDGRSLVEIDPENGPKVRRLFELYAYNSLTLDELVKRLDDDGIWYKESRRFFPGVSCTLSSGIGHTSVRSGTKGSGSLECMSRSWISPLFAACKCCWARKSTTTTN